MFSRRNRSEAEPAPQVASFLPYHVLTDYDVCERAHFGGTDNQGDPDTDANRIISLLGSAAYKSDAVLRRWFANGWDIGSPGITLRPDGYFCFQVRMLNGTVVDWDWDDPGRAVVFSTRFPFAKAAELGKKSGRHGYRVLADWDIEFPQYEALRQAAAKYETDFGSRTDHNAATPLIEVFEGADAPRVGGDDTYDLHSWPKTHDGAWFSKDASGAWAIDTTFRKTKAK